MALTGNHAAGIDITQNDAATNANHGINLTDNPTNPGILLYAWHQGTARGCIDIQNAPGANAAIVLHQYSNYTAALVLDNVQTQPLLLLRNSNNEYYVPGVYGSGNFFDLWGYSAGSPTVMIRHGYLSAGLNFASVNVDTPYQFTSMTTAPALKIVAGYGGTGLNVAQNSVAGAYAVNITSSSPQSAMVVTGTTTSNYAALQLIGVKIALSATTSGDGMYTALVAKNGTGAGTGLIVINKGTGASISIQDAVGERFAITPAGLPKWTAAANVQTTVGAAGAAAAPPATPSKFLKVVGDDGVTYVVPAYAAA